jgi:hypothetical protein
MCHGLRDRLKWYIIGLISSQVIEIYSSTKYAAPRSKNKNWLAPSSDVLSGATCLPMDLF